MQVGGGVAVVGHDAAQFELLADLGREFPQSDVDRLSTQVEGLEAVDVGRLARGCGLCDRRRELLELVVLGHEVGLGVDLHEDAAAGDYQALSRSEERRVGKECLL